MKEIRSNELKAKLEAGDPLAIVDIREADAYNEWHIPGSINIPVNDALKRRLDHALADRAEGAARMLYVSLREGLLGRVPDEVAICPAHHGKPIGFDGQPVRSTVGKLRSNLGLLGHGENEFVDQLLNSLTAKSPNHERIIAINEGRAQLDVDPLDVEAGPNRCAAG
jgi:rhodanese-related sulfurtransferase